ncbi:MULTISPECIES: ferrous iron transport protein A [Enterococcus]|jgi:ferrous iron transport protein A|uniref:ferrous iron transport protein A n=1 Tax=Enterococcus TaxID=1350 RepID=UPI0004516457|nr:MULTISPECIES: ferrous iron transport protein A [Enterococcus]EGO2738290.1 ferrous iron transport protein A [Enterococcus faecalis]EGO5082322.1 ferrous iron transport protein A [Enterococcus faecalis]EGO6123536.1 ferrous iron transport protein A [Enterococcus faecalis]EGO7588913.1 ferrous iron transport protein A [Enterococcus faecalis]EGO7949633.1 ferrous iron transport protein A [Enterococcus faecalis]
MITLAQAEVGKVYTVESVQADIQTKKHLNNLGVVAGQAVVLVNYQNQNGIVLLHNSRIALTDTILQAIHVEERSANEKVWVSLDTLKVGEGATIVGIHGQGAVKRRLMDMGLTKGTVIFIRKVAPLADPIEINVRGYELTLRKSEAELILVEKEESE